MMIAGPGWKMKGGDLKGKQRRQLVHNPELGYISADKGGKRTAMTFPGFQKYEKDEPPSLSYIYGREGLGQAKRLGDGSVVFPTLKKIPEETEKRIREIEAQQKALQLSIDELLRAGYAKWEPVHVAELREITKKEKVLLPGTYADYDKRIDEVLELLK